MSNIIEHKNISKRIEWLDFARMIAIIAVVLCHATEGVYSLSLDYISSISVRSKIFAFTVFTFGRIGVPLFLIISGYLLLDRTYDSQKIIKFWKNNWLHLLICTWIWFAIYDLFIILFNKNTLNVWTIIEDMFFFHEVNMGHVWYMPMILGMYILLPFVSIALKHIDNKLLLFPVLVFSIFSFVFPLVNIINNVVRSDVPLSNQFSLGYSGGAYGLYFIFGYMVKKETFKRIKTPIFLLITLLNFVLGVWLQIWSYANGVVYNMWYDCFLIMIVSVSLFEILSRLKNVYFYSTVKAISYYSFPIYLIHNIIRQVIKTKINSIIIIPPLKVFLMWLITFVSALVIAYLINRIPRIGKFVLYTK